jgi:AcrR family transcriptional regulator
MRRGLSRRKGRTTTDLAGVAPSSVPEERPGPPGGVRDLNRQARTRALADAALDQFLKHGIESVSIDDIARAAGVAKGTFYRYFADKDALVVALFAPLERAFAVALARCEAGIAAAADRATIGRVYEEIGLALGMLVVAHQREIRLYLQERRGPAAGARAAIAALAASLEAQTERLTTRARERGLLRVFPPRISALAVIGAAEQLLFALLSGTDLGDPSTVPALVTSLVMDGLRPR